MEKNFFWNILYNENEEVFHLDKQWNRQKKVEKLVVRLFENWQIRTNFILVIQIFLVTLWILVGILHDQKPIY